MLLTVPEISKLFNLDQSTINKWRQQKKITSYKKIGKNFMFEIAEVERVVALENLQKNGSSKNQNVLV